MPLQDVFQLCFVEVGLLEQSIFNQLRGHQIIRRTQHVGQRQIIGWLIDCHVRGQLASWQARLALNLGKTFQIQLALKFSVNSVKLIQLNPRPATSANAP